MATHVIILAAGEGKRMKSSLPKVAHPALGRSLVEWVLAAAEPLQPENVVVVVGHGADVVRSLLPPDVVTAVQSEQLGTGHAARIGFEALTALESDDVVMILYGDTPLLTTPLLSELATLEDSESGRLISAHLDDPTGYGRVLRVDGEVTGVVEHRDASPTELAIDEINAGIYALRAGLLETYLSKLDNSNAQGEYYLTDIVAMMAANGDVLKAVKAGPEDVLGINSPDQLAEASQELQRRVNQRHMDAGVTIIDPASTYIDASVTIAPGARIYPNTHLEGSTTVGAGAMVGPDVFAIDSEIGDETRVWYAVIRGALIGEGCEVGPYASLRPGTIMKPGSKLGTFVETKNTTLGEKAKANHLAYLGDADVGAGSNIGAGVVTVNYDGYEKHKTEVGEDAFVGSDTMLVAPVRVGDRAITGAGSVITRDVNDDALAIERNAQKEIPGYRQRREARKAAKDAKD